VGKTATALRKTSSSDFIAPAPRWGVKLVALRRFAAEQIANENNPAPPDHVRFISEAVIGDSEAATSRNPYWL